MCASARDILADTAKPADGLAMFATRRQRQMKSKCRLASGSLMAAALCVTVANAAPPAQISIPGQKVYPESLTTGADGSILIGSIGTGAIYKAKAGAASADT